jgi:hypothetical protein
MDDQGTQFSSPTPVLKARTVDTNVDLRLLQSHRLSHAAETGQLTPRTRRIVATSGDWSNAVNPERTTPEIEAEPESCFALPSPIALPLTAVVTDSFVESLLDAPSNTGDVPTAYSEHAVATAEELGRIFRLGEEFPTFSISTETLRIPEPTHSKEAFQHNPRDSQVVRKVNSSFEILRPGTLVTDTVTSTSPTKSDSDGSRRHLQRLRKSLPSTRERRRKSLLDVISGTGRHAH